MTAIAWLAVLGPIAGAACGIAVGYWMGVAANAEEMGAMVERSLELEASVGSMRSQLEALSDAPATRRESRRVLDLVVPNSFA